ncbi:MAG: autotransporter outer membrane beta-barrel domain-containing protein, partial [Planctomycetaceae bacterium]|nr:autotransporter outer membrane beta-barrel domain-containing protein [Planctomycetaceae bacterium]
FIGTIKLGAVDVDNSDASAYVTGVLFTDGGSQSPPAAQNIGDGANITVNSINVKADGATSYATGFSAGKVASTASITLGNVTVSGAGSVTPSGNKEILGIQFLGDVKGKIETGEINVTATGINSTAHGLQFHNGASDASGIVLGKITVDGKGSSNSNAVGINVLNTDNGGTLGTSKNTALKINASIEVTAKKNATGIYIGVTGEAGAVPIKDSFIVLDTSQDANLHISAESSTNGDEYSINSHSTGTDNLYITGKNDFTNDGEKFSLFSVENIYFETNTNLKEDSVFINETSNLTIDVTDGVAAVVGGINTVKNNTKNKLTVKGGGVLNVKNVLIAGDTTINKGTKLELNADTKNKIDGKLEGDGTLVIYGDGIKDGEKALEVTGTNTIADFYYIETFNTAYERVGSSYKAVHTGRSSIADGFLAAASIHNFNAGWEAARDHMISGRLARRNYGYMGQSPCDPCEPACAMPCNPCDPCGLMQGSSRTLWANYVVRSNEYQSSYRGNNNWNIGSNGVQAGVDLFRTSTSQLGVMFGYEKSDAEMLLNSVDANDTYFGFYAARVLNNGADFRAVANFGWQNYDSIRYSTLRGGRYFTTSFKGRTTEVNLEVGKRVYYSNSLSMRPVIGVDMFINDIEGSSENGFTTANGNALHNAASYGGLSHTQAFIRVGSDMKFQHDCVTLNGGLYYAYDWNGKDLRTNVSGINSDDGVLPPDVVHGTLYGSKLGNSILTFNASGTLMATQRLDIFGGFTGNIYLDRDGNPFQSVGYIGGALRW